MRNFLAEPKSERGYLLLEVLMATGIIALVAILIGGVVSVASNGTSQIGKRDTALALAEELFTGARAATNEKWQNLWTLTKGGGAHYYAAQSAGKWLLTSGDENVVQNGVSYNRYFYVANVSRHPKQRDIQAAYDSGNDDPSTQKVTVSVSWPDGSYEESRYLTRWRNSVCAQTSWSGIAPGPVTCPTTNYDSATGIDVASAPGSLKLRTNPRLQSVTGSNNGSTTVSANWPAATTTGNLLVAIVAVRGGSATAITPPAGGWTLAVRSDNGSTISTAIYYLQNAAAQSGSSSWALEPSAKATLTLVEYAGMQTSGALDQTASNIGTGVSVASGTTGTLTTNDSLAVGAVSAAQGNATFSNETNDFTEVNEVSSGAEAQGTRNNTVLEEKSTSVTTGQSVEATLSASVAWSGALAVFKVGSGVGGSAFPVSGELYSSVLQTTGSSDGPAYNSLHWLGTFGGPSQNRGKIQFQIATSTSLDGPWNFVGGSTCAAGDYFEPSDPGQAIEIKCPTAFNNQPYLRYRIQICSGNCAATGSYTPQVDEVVVNWSP